MTKKNDIPVEPPTFSDTEIARARKCFARGKELAAKKSYDYAIEMFINGLTHWPEAVEEGHKPCWAAALFRGGQKVGLRDKMKFKTNAKDPKDAMMNSEMLLTKDTKNLGYMESMFRAAVRGRFDEAAMWIGQIFMDATAREPKPDIANFELLRELHEYLGDANEETNATLAVQAMERAVEAQTRLARLKPRDMEVSTGLRDLAGKVTILRGKYSDADSFQDSIKDSDSQKEIHDRDRIIQADDRMDDLLSTARERYEAEPTNNGMITKYIDLLVRREDEHEEKVAVRILIEAYKATGEYRYKQRADEIRIRVLRRRERTAADPDEASKIAAQRKDYELKVYEERTKRYPTDMRVRFQYGQRLFRANPPRFDDAIPVLQEARNDPKVRFQCSLLIGRCFFEKGYHDQSADILLEALAAHESPDDELGKEMHYWLGRSYEAGGKTEDALKIYGQLIQWDYNYRQGDVRNRIDDLKAKN